jgi:hypothetical protein
LEIKYLALGILLEQQEMDQDRDQTLKCDVFIG